MRVSRPQALLGLLLVLVPSLLRAEPWCRDGDTLAICGDSITEQRVYSVYVEAYLLMCQPAKDLRTITFGWGGETSWDFVGRIESQVLPFRPTVASICYGMNDGGYAALTDERASKYRQALTAIATRFKVAGVRPVIVSPGCVDSHYFDIRYRPGAAEIYNKSLAALRDIARAVAEREGCGFADVHQAMYDVMTKAKAKFGAAYPVAGTDGFHPVANGHLVMAYALLKGLGCDGDIGTIEVDLRGGRANAGEGHVVRSFDGTSITIESRRYPFCFYPDPNAPLDPRSSYSTRAIIDFVPFNSELNRFRLVVTGLPADGRAVVTWGEGRKEFSAAQLSEGINLAAEFLDNPFCSPFKSVETAIRAQQDYEFPMARHLLYGAAQCLPDETELRSQLFAAVTTRQRQLADAARAAVAPIVHTIRVESIR